MTSVWIITSALQRIKDVRTPGARRYKGRTNFLSNRERREQVASPEFKPVRGTHFLESPDGEAI